MNVRVKSIKPKFSKDTIGLILVRLFFLLLCISMQAQNLSEASIVSKYERFKSISNLDQKKDSISALAREIATGDAVTALSHFELLDSIVQEPLLKLEFYIEWSSLLFKQGANEKTRQLRKKALNIATAENIPYEQFNYTNSLATFYVNLSNADSASYYAKELELLVAQHPDELEQDLWLAYMRNSSVEGILGNTEKEGLFLERAYEEKAKHPMDSNLGFVLYMVTDFYRKQKDIIKQSKYTELLVKHYEKRKINTPEAHFPFESLLLTENTPEAISELERVIKASDSLKFYNSLSASTVAITRAHFQNEEPEKAIAVLQRTINILKQANYPVNSSVHVSLLQEAYAKSDDFENAYYNVLEQQKLEDSLRSKQTLDNIANYEVKYKTAETQLELEKKNAAQKFLYAIIISAVILAAIIGYFLYKNRRKNLLLSAQKSQLENALSEKEMLLKEIHHRVKNNLQVISSLLSLQQRQIDDPNASNALKVGRDRVKAMSLIHENLYQEGNLIGVSVTDYINKLAKSLIANYRVEHKDIKLNLDVDEIQLDVDTIIPIGLIINELVSNTLKYAFADQAEGSISISLKQEKENLRLTVDDTGIGLPDNFVIEETASLGFRLVKAFSEKLKATLSVNSNAQGTKVGLLIPKLK